MKKRIIPILLLCILLLAGCTRGQIYEFRLSGQEFVADLENNTLTVGSHTYTFAQTGSSYMDRGYTITYPNGSTYTEQSLVKNGTIVKEIITSEGFDSQGYLQGDHLVDAVKQAYNLKEQRKDENQKDISFLIFGVICLVLGFIQFRYPEGIWYMKHWWCVDGGEPSDMYLDMSRAGGGLSMILGLILMIVGIT